MDRACNHLLRAMPGPSGSTAAHHPLIYPTQAPPLTWPVPQGLELYLNTNWFKKGAGGGLEPDLHVFPVSFITSNSSQPSSGCRVSILPGAPPAPQPPSYFFLQSWLLAPGKMARLFCLKWRKRATKLKDHVLLSSRGDTLKWGQWFGVVLKQNRSVELKEHLIAVVYKGLRRPR